MSRVWILSILLLGPAPDKGGLPLRKVDVTEPRQTALIAFDGSVETLYISSILRPAQKTRVLEILPLPGEPTAELADSGVILRAAAVYNDRVQKELARRAKERGRGTLRALILTGCIALLMAFSAVAIWRKRSCLSALTFIALVGTLGLVLMPGLLASQGVPVGSTVEILSHQQLGPHSLTIVKTKEPADISAWVGELFKKEGGEPAAFDAGWKELLESYVRQGCSNFAVDLIDADPLSGPIAPIRYTFPTKEPWFPLRISSRGTGSSDVLLLCLLPRSEVWTADYEHFSEVHFQMRTGFDLSPEEVKSIDSKLADRLEANSSRLFALRFNRKLEDLKADFVLRRRN